MFDWEDELKVELTKAIEEAMERFSEEAVDFPYRGRYTSRIMAEAALAVLRGMGESQEQMRADGTLSE